MDQSRFYRINKDMNKVWVDEIKTLPEPFNEMEEFTIAQFVEMMKEPVRAVNKCASKGQLQTLCVQLLAKNLALQKQVNGLVEALVDAAVLEGKE